MTVDSEQSVFSYAGNGVTVDFNFSNTLYEKTSIDVTQVVDTIDSSGVVVELVLDTDYTVALASDFESAVITVTTAVPSLSTITIARNQELLQEDSYQNGGPFPAKSHEKALDREITAAQSVKQGYVRTPRLPFYLPPSEVLDIASNPLADFPKLDRSTGKWIMSVIGNIGTAIIQDGAVTTPKLSNGAVTAEKMEDLAAYSVFANPTGSTTTPAITDVNALPVIATGSTTRRSLGDRFSDTANVDDFGAVGDGATDDTAAFNAAIATISSRGGTLILQPKVYLIPGGITELKKGIRVIGLGTRMLTPNVQATIGAVVKSTTAGVWCWTHGAASAGANDYEGETFENVTFEGNAVTAGGFRSFVNGTTVINCDAVEHKTGIGFLFSSPTGGADDGSWNYIQSNMAVNCLTGFDVGGGNAPKSTGSELVGNITLKVASGGIQDTGVGFHIKSGNVTILGGKAEQDATGYLIESPDAVTITGARLENCGTVGIHLNRSAEAFSSRIKLTGCVFSTTNTLGILIGANNAQDVIMGCDSSVGITDNGDGTLIYGRAAGSAEAAVTINAPTGGGKLESYGVGNTTSVETSISAGGALIEDMSVGGVSKIIKLGSDLISEQLLIQNASGTNIMRVFGNGNIQLEGGGLGFFGTGAGAKPTIVGSAGGNAALQSLLTALDTLGLITDSST